MIRQWESRDSIQIRKLIKALLVGQHKYGSSALPSEFNVNYYLHLGFEQIRKNNDPHLLYEEDGEVLGILQIGETLSVLEIRGKSAELYTMYTKPEARDRFINIELIREGGIRAIAKGYTRVCSSVMMGNSKALKNLFYNPSIWPTSTNIEWAPVNDPQIVEDQVSLIERKEDN